ncbi:MAG: outer membrane protein transport protein [Deltaproteobacteria bacterium]|nr:outer membrane protein transport protein [Deltaproteobacteria bacterium]
MLRKIILLVLVAIIGSSCRTLAAGYRIPEQSLNSTALSSAYVANATAPDMAYYNPANMAWAQGGWDTEYSLSLINLPSIKYTDSRGAALNGGTEEEYFTLPAFFAVSPEFNNFRFGFAMVSPAGLTKRWEDPYPGSFAEETAMMVVEANPSFSYRISDVLAIGLGVRFIYSDATMISNGVIAGFNMTRDMEGDTVEFGYNLALTLKPAKALTLAATYRSEIDLEMEGDAVLTSNTGSYIGPGSVSIPIPAVLTLAAAYSFEKTSLELVYERSYWSAYKQLNFEYPVPLGDALLTLFFDDPTARNWDDVNAYKLGLTYFWNKQLRFMAGGGLYGNPVPDSTISFDLPDSDSWFASLGFRYQHNKKMSYGAACLHAEKEDRTAVDAAGVINGRFSGAASNLLAFSISYLF